MKTSNRYQVINSLSSLKTTTGIRLETNKLKNMLENADRIIKRSLRLGYIAIALGGLALIVSIIPFTK